MEANEWVYPQAQYSGTTPVLNQKSANNEILDLQEEVKDFLQLGQYNMVDNIDKLKKIKPNRQQSLAQISSNSDEKNYMVERLRLKHRAKNEFFEDFSLDSMTGSDDGNYQA